MLVNETTLATEVGDGSRLLRWLKNYMYYKYTLSKVFIGTVAARANFHEGGAAPVGHNKM